MVELLIIADDYTGAIDTGVQLTKAGICTMVTTGPDLLNAEHWSKVTALVVDAESRHLSPAAAYQTVYSLARQAVKSGINCIYKKTDSTLRGNIGAELAAVMDATGSNTLLFAPASPDLNRLTIGGVQYVNGHPLSETSFAKDPFTPVCSSYIPEIIAQQTDIPVVLASPDTLPEQDTDSGERRILLIDSQKNQDFVQISNHINKQGRKLLAGSSGFSGILPALIDFTSTENLPLVRPKKALVVCGSLHKSSLQQTAIAEELGVPCIVLEHAQKQMGYVDSETGRAFLQTLCDLYRRHNCIILKTVVQPEEIDAQLHRPGDASPGNHLVIANHVGQLVTKLQSQNDIDMLIVFGGDTLFGILENLCHSVVWPQVEIFPGVVQSRIEWGENSIALVSKAGGFGMPETLVNLLHYYGLLK